MARATGVAALILLLTTPLAAQTPRATEGVRDARYCEVFVVGRELLRFSARVYNTLGLNDGPPALWLAIDPGRLKTRFGAEAIMMNGPRHFVMDRVESADIAGSVTDMDGLAMRYLATLDLPLSVVREGRRPYEVHRVARTTRYVYAAGRPVFELVDPAGRVFVMQAYAQIVDPAMTLDALPSLGTRLRLPPGWQFRVRTPASDMELRTAGDAEIVQDELQNTYQLMR
jgi:hypothetical protein